MSQKIADQQQDFAQWYHDVVYESALVDQSPTRGCTVIRPYGYAIWELIQQEIDRRIKKTGTQNAYFPLLIPESFLRREAQHVEGFSPELAVVTHAGGEKLEEPYVVRPTSETIIYHMFARWISSWRDLPLKINQWANVVRWEMRTRPFLRTGEFLWQEGHTAHATRQEAIDFANQILRDVYKNFAHTFLAIPVITGQKTESEKFPGAEITYTFEALMQDGKALQMGTSHVLAHSFPEAFDVKFQDKDGSMAVPFCTSWAITTRLIGAVVMVHGDQRGLIIPPRIAPIQAIIIPIAKTAEERVAVLECAGKIVEDLSGVGIRIQLDDDDQKTPGAKFFQAELRGIPLRIELGPRDLAQNQVVVVRRALLAGEVAKVTVSMDDLGQKIPQMLDAVHEALFEAATQRLKNQWHQVEKLADFGPKLEAHSGLYQAGFCGGSDCEAQLKTYKATARCLIGEKKHTVCFACDKLSKGDLLIAKAY